MTFNKLVLTISRNTGILQADVRLVLKMGAQEIKSEILSDGKINIPNFGTFSLKNTKCTQVTEPYNGKLIKIPSHSIPKFSPSVSFRKVCKSKLKLPDKYNDFNIE